MNRILKRMAARALYHMNPVLKNGASILMYHSVGRNQASFSVTPEAFEEQMLYLKSSGTRIAALRELVDALHSNGSIQGMIAVTFDDGYKDNIEIAAPILRKYGIPATFFVASGLLGSEMVTSEGVTLPMMSEGDISDLSRESGFDIMPHTRSHVPLNAITFTEAAREIETSKKDVERLTGKKADIFAYPKGKYNDELIVYIKNAGWRGAVTVRQDAVHSESNPFLLPRANIAHETSMEEFRMKTSGALSIYSFLKKYTKIRS